MIRIKIRKKPIENRTILNNRDIEIKEGSFNIITGPSGVGKSSLLNIIGLLDNAFVGEYEFFGKKVEIKDNNITTYIRRKYFGFIFQDSLINVKQNITRNILCSVNAQNIITARERINDILVSVGLSNINDNVSFLSGGEKQRLALARALIKNPSILLADEPTASLDIKNKKLVMNILSEYNKLGGTVVMVTHDLELIDDNMNLIQLLNT
ncbi:dispersin export ABC transporter ATP-binding protein AatC [Escherichia coli]|jgi:putative ABC transport system ATP-binding protein|uniref:dispersin export ABC transporter ATP-binding protein AatC n=1 Tax=Escherichia coli TaxID=562 RepID=UPI00050BCBE1|nr:dispersin export ABC transporter ATP-binding protein AatC [Escherichia coli]EAB1277975.1 dispersin export ABC transporter ATP-binding protein AatC [Escherichia coli]EEV7462314.1 dispersin export ABC transporter ATP-binding protein AatC [Escherichia coli]EEV9335471.1 dispersin export ABC transporter ATP-binding protein AatC [Escherichia coli]EEV9385725.1 dispersin export ABC transporter ATP-binding protein AatC [Escherichia coli]EEV9410630.1 dispersin export ABC transporter ATP-binding prote